MFSRVRSATIPIVIAALAACVADSAAQTPPSREQILSAMKRATTFMVEKVAHRGGYVWNYLPDMTRRWGEMEARPTMIWIQPPGTPSMGHLFLDAYHATGDEYYYRAAEQVASALAAAQHPSGGWNYLHDFAGDASLRSWYATVGKNGWRLEEFQHYHGNATFDDAGTAESAKFFLRLYLEKKDPKHKAPLDKAIRFVIDSQYPNGLWPQRFPKAPPEYSSYPTFNDDVAGENIEFLLLCYQALGNDSVLPPIARGMDSFLITQMAKPQAGWGLQHTPDLQPAAARTYEPKALVTHTTAANVSLLLRFYRLTGDAKYLARIPDALDWLDSVRLPAGIAPAGRSHPTFVALGTNEPLYVHRIGSNVVNGRYFVDNNPRGTIVHYSSFRAVDVTGLRKQYDAARGLAPEEIARTSPLKLPPGSLPLPKYHVVGAAGDAAKVMAALNAEGYWLAPLGNNSHPYVRDGSPTPQPGDFSQTYVGDDTDTSPFPDPKLMGISVEAYVRNMSVLIRALESPQARHSTTWRLDNTARLGSDALQVVGAPAVVPTEIGSALQFNGTSDGVFLDTNPIEGLRAFTIEVLFSPDADGPVEQRFLHMQETTGENRALVELRLNDGRWALDTYLRSGTAQRTLLDPTKTHAAPGWHVATLTFDGAVMAHYVDGVEQGRGEVAFAPLGAGQTSVGVRQNRVSWFKGRIHTVRVSSSVLTPSQFLTVPARVIDLWPEGVPGRKPDGGAEQIQDGAVSNVHQPTLTYFAPASGKATGTAMILCAGGSYGRLALDNEMAGLTPRLTERGIAVFVLKYRLADYGHPAPLRDVLRAIRTVRSRASEFGLRENRIGVFGASAGGHLAASAATWFDAPEGRTGAAIDAVSARPDFVSLLYPVVTMRPPHAHAASRRNLLGESPAPAAVDRLSIELQARADMPPFFVVHTAEDASVPIEHSYALVQALRAKQVPVEAHFYEKGAHGFGVSASAGAASAWPDRLLEWLSARGFVATSPRVTRWARGVEGQRKADLDDGTFLNPIMAGDHPDPSILRDGDDYYMTFSSFDAYPGLVIWHSRDLVNWQPIGPALFKNVGSVWAPDLVKHDGRYYIYFPAIGDDPRTNYVVWADDIRGPWSPPIDLEITRIDPGHAVGPDGRRYLFLSAGELVPLAADGLSTTGPPKQIYDGWKYPADWVVETFAQEGPKVLKRGDYYYMVLAQGGTAGPATGHMIVAARSRTIEGPWEHSPYNPILRTQSSDERWWSKGHGTLIDDRAGRWWMVYHAYENGYYTLGRQTLLEPVEWTADGWFRMSGADPAAPIAKPAGEPGPHGFPFTDDFSRNKMGLQWSFYDGDEADRDRYRYENGSLVLKAKGTSPATASPLWFVTGDHAYEIEVEIDADATASAGVLVFYSRKLYAGLGLSAKNLLLHTYGMDRTAGKPPHLGQRVHLRLRNDRHIVTIDYSADGQAWTRFDRAIEVSGYHHNVAYDFLSLRPALYAAGQGEVRFRNFKYRALP